MLEQEQAFYEAHQTEFREKYLGKRIVLAGEVILGIYDSDREAYMETVKTRKPGSFMIKYIPEDPEDEVLCIFSPLVTVSI